MLHIKTFHMMLVLPCAESAKALVVAVKNLLDSLGAFPAGLSLTLAVKPEGDKPIKTQLVVKILIINALYKRRAEVQGYTQTSQNALNCS
jgi:hypothetical protein